MLPRYHIVLGFLFSGILFFLFPQIDFSGFLIIFASSVLIDFDAYLNYAFLKKDFSLSNAVKYWTEKRKKGILLSRGQKAKTPPIIRIFHGVEVLAVLFVLGIFISKFFLFIFIGFLFHLFLDIAEQMYFGFRITKVSLAWDVVRKFF